MNYELAKQLNDAGWKYKDGSQGIPLSYPTLSELIEACGDGFDNLTKKHNDGNISFPDGTWWISNFEICGPSGETWDECASFGKTPEEAVAKLWFELHKH